MSCNSSQTSLRETILLTPRNTVRPATNAVGTTWTHTEPGTTNLSVHSQSPPFRSMPRPVSYFRSPQASLLWSTSGLFWTHGDLLWQRHPSLRGVVLLFIAYLQSPSKLAIQRTQNDRKEESPSLSAPSNHTEQQHLMVSCHPATSFIWLRAEFQ